MLQIIKKSIKQLVGLNSNNRCTLDHGNTQIEQRRLAMHYKNLLDNNKPLPSLNDVGFRTFSQNDEDGILLYIFSLIGTTNKLCVDLAFASASGANTTNLLCNWGWSGLLICGSEQETSNAKIFFNKHDDTKIFPPSVITQWITAENINETLSSNNMSGEIDLFSLDIDGVDYWIWKNLSEIQPRVVVVEYSNLWPADCAVTVPYKADFNRFNIHEDYMGASLLAFVKLAEAKGYQFVGCNKYCFNAFFVRKDLCTNILPHADVQEGLKHPQALYAQMYRLPKIQHYDWINV